MKYTNEILTIEQLINLKNNKEIYMDESFQVGTDEVSRWGKREQKRYLNSVLSGSAPSPFILVDVKKALKYAEEAGTDNESIEYFQNLLNQGYKYVSVDGNNRSISLLNFYKNQVTMPHGNYEDEYDRPIAVKKGYDKFKTLNKLLLKMFLNSTITVAVYKKIRKKDLNRLFRNVNDGMKLNYQQIRQSYPSLLAQYVRDKRKTFKTALMKFTSSKNYIVLKADEFIAKCIAYAVYSETDKKTLDSVYIENNASQIVKPAKTDSIFNRVLNTVLTTIKKSNSLVNLNKSQNAVFDYFCIAYDYKLNNVKIDRPQDFFDLWLETVGKMFADDKKFYEYEKKSGHKVSETFKDIVRHPYKNAQTFRKKLILDKIEKVAFEKKILIQQENPDDYFSHDDKVKMWERQKGICPRTKKTIPFEEIADHTKWHGDAVIPKDKGGTHTLDNGELIDAYFNIKKSNKLI